MPEKYHIEVAPDTIWQEIGDNRPDETKIIFVPKDKEGIFADLHKDVFFVVYDAQGHILDNKIKAKLETEHYEAVLKAQDLGYLEYRISPYVFTIKPEVSGLNIPGDCKRDIKVYAAKPTANSLKFDISLEKKEISAEDSIKVTLTITDSLGNKRDVPADFLIGEPVEKAKDSGASISSFERVSEGIYEATFTAGKHRQDYSIEVSYNGEKVGQSEISVYSPKDIDAEKSRFFVENNNASFSDEKGITLVLEAKGHFDNSISGLSANDLRFEFEDPQEYLTQGELKELEDKPGTYQKIIYSKESGDFLVKLYFKNSQNEEVLYAKTVTVCFGPAEFSEKAEYDLEHDSLWQNSSKPGYYRSTKIKFKPMNGNGGFAYLGKEIKFSILDASGIQKTEVVAPLVKAGDAYEGQLNVSDIEEEVYNNGDPYIYKIVPKIGDKIAPESQQGSIKIYPPLPKAKDVTVEFLSEETIYYLEDVDSQPIKELKFRFLSKGKPIQFSSSLLETFVKKQNFPYDAVPYALDVRENEEKSNEGKIISSEFESDGTYIVKFYPGEGHAVYKLYINYIYQQSKPQNIFEQRVLVRDPFVKILDGATYSITRSNVKYADWWVSFDAVLTAKDKNGNPISGLKFDFEARWVETSSAVRKVIEVIDEIRPGEYHMKISVDVFVCAVLLRTFIKLEKGNVRYYPKELQDLDWVFDPDA